MPLVSLVRVLDHQFAPALGAVLAAVCSLASVFALADQEGEVAHEATCAIIQASQAIAAAHFANFGPDTEVAAAGGGHEKAADV